MPHINSQTFITAIKTMLPACILFFSMGCPLVFADDEQPEILPPVFSQKGGFYQDGFELQIENPHPGTYEYVVTKAGYDDQSGQVTIEARKRRLW